MLPVSKLIAEPNVCNQIPPKVALLSLECYESVKSWSQWKRGTLQTQVPTKRHNSRKFWNTTVQKEAHRMLRKEGKKTHRRWLRVEHVRLRIDEPNCIIICGWSYFWKLATGIISSLTCSFRTSHPPSTDGVHTCFLPELGLAMTDLHTRENIRNDALWLLRLGH